MINFFGFVLDWLITRNWRPVFMLLAVPVILFVALLITGVWGALLDKTELAEKYLSIGERELGDAGQDWAFDLSSLNKDLSSDSSSKVASEIPRFTESVFQRVKQLQGDNPRATYVIGAIMGQKGALTNAIFLMKSIAPDGREGYLPAHAWLANLLLQQQPLPKDQLPTLQHHLSLGATWSGAPDHLKVAAVQQLLVNENDTAAALELLREAAEKQPDSEALFRMAVQMGGAAAPVANKTSELVLARLLESVKARTATTSDRIALADVLYYRGEFDAARGVLEDGLKSPGLSNAETKELNRALSDFYRLRFIASGKVVDGKWTADVGLLDRAMRVDPSNPKVAEEVAMLARIRGDSPPEALINQLNEFLAEGKATPLTHAWIAEAYILRNEYPKAIEHLRSVIARMPDAAHSHNNLAYAIALSEPSRMQEALEHAMAAVKAGPRFADFHDTLGFIYMKLNRTAEAISEMEIAIELQPERPDFHERLAEAYANQGTKEMASIHLQLAAKYKAMIESQGKK